MINPVTFAAGASAALARPSPDDALKRQQLASRATRVATDSGTTRVDISAEGVQQSQAESEARLQQTAAEVQAEPQAAAPARQPAPAAQAPAPAGGAAAPAATSAAAVVAAIETDLAFAVADGNQDGTVTIAEQQSYEARHLRITVPPPAEGQQGAAGSGPIRAYLTVEATLASI